MSAVETLEIIGAGWTAARVALLVDHYHAGLSAGESADLIGEVSKNAVVSKRRRLGLVATVLVGCGSDWGGEREDRPARVVYRSRPFPGPPPLPVEPLPEMEFALPPNANPKPLVARGLGECAWPIGPAEALGDYRTLFCSAPVKPGRCYCASHAARAYRPRT